ncbi:MAG: hypothetical protein LBC70_01665 [Chitinispirillales bacterium]|jgi:uncharacterized membrane protein|nr:hypothetical protein [Chitinispirillales bacterium]
MTGKIKVFAATAVCVALVLACASTKTVHLDFNNVPDNERCDYMKDVCRDAERFEAQFEQMGRDERQDARTILNAYIQQCADAQAMCQATMRE